jgi:RNA polymerase sigma-70 factor (ECF subfamily)
MEAAIIVAARNGDETAVRALYRHHAPRLERVVAGWVRDPSMVEDLCQESWLRAWRSLSTFRGDAGFGTWLHAIARNVMMSRSRSRQRRAELMAEREPPPTAESPEPVELRIDLKRAVEELPPGMRRILWLHDVEGWTHEQIGAALDVTVGTSKSQLFKARARVRRTLTGAPETH